MLMHKACAVIDEENKRLAADLHGLLDSVHSHLHSRRDALVDRFFDGVGMDMPVRAATPRRLPCADQLEPALKAASAKTQGLLRDFAAHADDLAWGQTYSAGDLGADFLENYGWVELFGTRGHFVHDMVAGGILVLGPHTHYLDHHHVAEELYLPLTSGTAWRKGDGPFGEQPADTLIHHPSNVNHAMRTGDAPLVAIYLWRGGPLAAKSTLTPS